MKFFLKAAITIGLINGVVAVPAIERSDGALSQDSSSSQDKVEYGGNSEPNCKAVSFTVTGTAENRNLTGSIPVDSLDHLRRFVNASGFITVSGPQTLAATFCKPTVANKNNGKIQVLFGSALADRSGWNAQGGTGTNFTAYKPELYSWVRFANAKGYPTLAFDRLGTGISSKPDPTLVVQAKYEAALYYDVAKQIRAGAPQLDKKYEHLIYVGNSYGSELGAGIAGDYPDAYNEFILTGFSNNIGQGFAGVALGGIGPAASVMPARFSGLDPGYLTEVNETGRTNSFFGSHAQADFEDRVAALFYQRENLISTGQYVSAYTGAFDGTGFRGRVLVLTGEQDQIFCGPGSSAVGPAHCGPLLAQTGALFPDADYNYQSVDRTGHAIQLFLTSRKVFAIAHQFLAGREFKGGPPA